MENGRRKMEDERQKMKTQDGGFMMKDKGKKTERWRMEYRGWMMDN